MAYSVVAVPYYEELDTQYNNVTLANESNRSSDFTATNETRFHFTEHVLMDSEEISWFGKLST